MLDAVTDMLGKDEVGDYTLPDPTEQFYSHTAHHIMGTTRMNGDPKKGVVDANCKVYGVSNLYVAGSSVFTTGGYANPTLTILALSLRLADHLNEN
jgi:choline dehydrogenase-like flavoprotein